MEPLACGGGGDQLKVGKVGIVVVGASMLLELFTCVAVDSFRQLALSWGIFQEGSGQQLFVVGHVAVKVC